MKKWRSHRMVNLLFTLLITTSGSSAWGANSSKDVEVLNGWCFPASDCTGVQSPIQHGVYETCEETCELRRPVRIRGLPAVLLDVVCKADGMSPRNERVLFISRQKNGSVSAMHFIDKQSIIELERCN